MTLYQFNLLEDNDKKAAVVWEHGVHVASRISSNSPEVNILLYQLPKFYVEVFYNNNENRIVRFLSFSSANNLEPYLGEIDITDLKIR